MLGRSKNEKMKIVVLLPKLHAGAEIALNALLRKKDLHVTGIVRSDISPWKKKYWKYFWYGLRRAGIFYGALIALTAYLPLWGLAIASLCLWHRKRKWLTTDELIRKYGLKVLDTEDINATESVKTLHSWKPDMMVSLSFDQILRPSALRTSKDALNLHPGILPRYRGLWPIFWKLLRKEKYAGITIHRMTEKIDEGEILALKHFRIRKNDTKVSLTLKSARTGALLLIETLRHLKRGVPKKIRFLRGTPGYNSFPTKTDFDRFFATGKKLFSVRSVVKELLRNY